METLEHIVDQSSSLEVPTRWGNKLNGNILAVAQIKTPRVVPTRWGNKLNRNLIVVSLDLGNSPCVPTRWGNKLNGNAKSDGFEHALQDAVPTRWGNKLNGNSKKRSNLLFCSRVCPHSLGK